MHLFALGKKGPVDCFKDHPILKKQCSAVESDWVSKESSDGIYLIFYTEMLFLIQKPVIMLEAVSLIVNCTVTLVETRLELTLVVYHLRKRFRKIRLESKWITTPCIVPAENFQGQRNI